MKNVLIAILILVVSQTIAQNEIETTVLKGDQLINYAADNFPSEEAQHIYVLVETGNAGVSPESRFYLEKGIQLLLNRLEDDDQIAIGVYGENQGTVLPYTSVKLKEMILQKIERLYQGIFIETPTDGIDVAYTLAQQNYNDEGKNTVVMLRGTDRNTASMATSASTMTTTSLSNRGVQLPITHPEKTSSDQIKTVNHSKVGGAIVLTALTILPELIGIIKN